jgi:hypothetical protein
MPINYIPNYPNAVEGQAILGSITRTQRVLHYREILFRIIQIIFCKSADRRNTYNALHLSSD